jgi:hypothetical protein
MTISLRGSITSGTQASGATVNVTVPTGVVAGDVVIVSLMEVGTALTTLTPPAGDTWTVTRTTSTSVGTTFYVATKVASGTDSGTYAFTLDASTVSAYECAAFSGSSGVDGSPVTWVDPGGSAPSPLSLTGQAITATNANSMYVWCGYIEVATAAGGWSQAAPTGGLTFSNFTALTTAAGTRAMGICNSLCSSGSQATQTASWSWTGGNNGRAATDVLVLAPSSGGPVALLMGQICL